jgi:hydroxymethylglutaryl-CoA synthase
VTDRHSVPFAGVNAMADRTDKIGIAAIASYLPRYRLTAEEIARTRRHTATAAASRRLAGFDEDALTIAVESGRRLGSHQAVTTLVFSTTTPPYLVKNNASAAHAALSLPEDVPAFDLGGAGRSWVGALRAGRPGTLLLTGEVSTARPGALSELRNGDAGSAVLLGGPSDSIAEIIEAESATEELLDLWRLPGTPWLSASEDRFPPSRYAGLLDRVLARLFDRIDAASVDHVVVSAASGRVATAAARILGRIAPVSTFAGVGFAGTSDLPVQLNGVLAHVAPGATILAVSLADGCDAIVVRATDQLSAMRPAALRQADDGEVPTYLDALTWRGLLDREPPRRPEPRPVSPPASSRALRWKYALHGAVCRTCGAVSSPPQQVCVRCGAVGSDPVDLSRERATVRTFSVDRLAFSPNPPLVAAVVDFDGGGRLEVEITDCDPTAVTVGQRVRMTFRRRHSSDGIHNYAWKATPEETGDG